MLREGAGREASPTAAIVDTQSVKITERGGPRGWDAAKRLKGRKRHVAVDTDGLLLGILVHAADIQDADGFGDLLKRVKPLHPGSGSCSPTVSTIGSRPCSPASWRGWC
jgi:putative transposase